MPFSWKRTIAPEPLRRALHRPKRRFPFFSLPPELRNRIYEYIFSDHPREFWLLSRCSRIDIPGVLRVNKQLYHEAAAYYWASGHFDFMIRLAPNDHFELLLKRISVHALKLLTSNRDVTVHTLIPKHSKHYKEYRSFPLLSSYALKGLGDTKVTRNWIFSAEHPNVRKLSHCCPAQLSDARWIDARDIGPQVRRMPGSAYAIMYLHCDLILTSDVVFKVISAASGDECMRFMAQRSKFI